tara:strand:+ start:32082 stop:32339 length:258 start_codon:yes stop_codon:yes gene_type:complete
MVENCGHLVRRLEYEFGIENYEHSACLRRGTHYDELHVFKNSKGQYFSWESDWGCDCCEPEDVDRCFDYGEISEEEALELIRGHD